MRRNLTAKAGSYLDGILLEAGSRPGWRLSTPRTVAGVDGEANPGGGNIIVAVQLSHRT